MFDSNAMQELAHIKADRYQRAGGGGAHKVYNTSKAYDDARGFSQMSEWDQLEYMSRALAREWNRQRAMDAIWEAILPTLDTVNGEIPF